jgi:hypothetical protein
MSLSVHSAGRVFLASNPPYSEFQGSNEDIKNYMIFHASKSFEPV